MITVLIADDQILVRNILKRILQSAGDIEIVAMAANGKEALEQAVLHSPDVAVMDVSMPNMDGTEAIRQICARCPETRVLVLSMYNLPEYIGRCVRAGAFGYVLKDMAIDDLVPAVHSLYEGDRYFSKSIAEVAKRYISP